MKKIILVKVAWMKYYEGRANIDIPMSGAKYIKENKKGGEINLFKNFAGKAYGYIPFNYKININNLGAGNNDEFIQGVTVVFCASHPKEGLMRVVGWHKNSLVHRTSKSFNSNNLYHSVSKFKDCKLIPFNDRTLKIPNVFGRNSVCYIANHKSKAGDLKRIEDYITSGGKLETEVSNRKKKVGRAFQPDIEKRILVEQTAINIAKTFYGARYGLNNVKSVETDNVGWDLEIITAKFKLKVEVKGLSGSELNVQMTPNEFAAFNKKALNYHLFVVTDTLSKPITRVFEYQSKGNIWVANDKSELDIKPIYAARLILKI